MLSTRCFPSPALWRTLREQCVRWRHRAPLTEQWARVSLCLTARLLAHMYGPLYPAMPIGRCTLLYDTSILCASYKIVKLLLCHCFMYCCPMFNGS